MGGVWRGAGAPGSGLIPPTTAPLVGYAFKDPCRRLVGRPIAIPLLGAGAAPFSQGRRGPELEPRSAHRRGRFCFAEAGIARLGGRSSRSPMLLWSPGLGLALAYALLALIFCCFVVSDGSPIGSDLPGSSGAQSQLDPRFGCLASYRAVLALTVLGMQTNPPDEPVFASSMSAGGSLLVRASWLVDGGGRAGKGR